MMLFWVLAGLMCLATIGILALGFRKQVWADDSRNEAALSIYKDQLKELDRDVAAGSITAEEADGQRAEISRRLIAANQAGKEFRGGALIAFPKWMTLVVPAFAALVYWQIGNYKLPDVPRADRLNAAQRVMDDIQAGNQPESIDMPAMLALIEKRVEDNPREIASWHFLASNYLNAGRFADAANAFDRIIAISGPTAELYAGMGEATVFGNNGLLTEQSTAIFREALKLDPKDPKARYYDAMGMAQQGQKDSAKKAFEALLADSPANAPWRRAVETQIAELSPNATAPQLSDEQIKNARDMSAEDRMAMIRSMVEGLDAKLKDNPQDIEGWMRLVRARTVLNEQDKAVAALATARQTFAGKDGETKLLNDLATELKLQ